MCVILRRVKEGRGRKAGEGRVGHQSTIVTGGEVPLEGRGGPLAACCRSPLVLLMMLLVVVLEVYGC